MTLCNNHVAHCCVSWFLCAVTWFAVLPWSSYRFYQLWVRRHVQILWVRRVQFDIFPVVIVNVVASINICLFMLKTVAGASVGPTSIHRLLLTIGMLHASVVIIYKVLLSYIDLRFAYVTRELSWKSLIITDPDSHHELMNSKYIVWRQTWLSPRYLAFIFGIYAIICTILLIWMQIGGYGKDLGSANAIMISFVILILVYMWFRTPSIFDAFGIREEIKMISLIGVCGVCGFVGVKVVMSAVDMNDVPLDYLLASVVFFMGSHTVLYVFTEHRYHLLSDQVRKWDSDTARSVLRSHVKAKVRSTKMARQMTDLGVDSEIISQTKVTSDLSVHSSGSRLTAPDPRYFANRAITKSVMAQMNPSLSADDICTDIEKQPSKQLISNRLFAHCDCIAVFADFLFREISIENLIGFIEFYQLSVSLSAEMDDENMKVMLNDFSLNAEVVPISSINQSTDYSHSFILLCDKYIGQHSHYRLNLPFTLVQKIERLLMQIEMQEEDEENDKSEALSMDDKQEILRLSFQVVQESRLLLSDTFSRFQMDPLFKEYLNVDIES